MGIGAVELFVLALSMVGPFAAAAYLASRLSRRRREGQPTTHQ